MSRWFRFYGDVLNDPKVQMLSGDDFKSWVNVLCVASQNGGVLPEITKLSFMLRMSVEDTSHLLDKLCSEGLIDPVEVEDAPMSYEPHNWRDRQFKSDAKDPTSADRQKAYRDRNATRNADRNGTVTRPVTQTVTVTPPREQITDTDTEKNTEPNGSGAVAPIEIDYRKQLFGKGLDTLARLTGRGPSACRSFLGKCLKEAADDAVFVLGVIEDAEREQVVDASSWIAARVKGRGPPFARPVTQSQQNRSELKGILDDLSRFAESRGDGRRENLGLLPGDSGQRPQALRGGVGADVIDLPGGSYQSSG